MTRLPILLFLLLLGTNMTMSHRLRVPVHTTVAEHRPTEKVKCNGDDGRSLHHRIVQAVVKNKNHNTLMMSSSSSSDFAPRRNYFLHNKEMMIPIPQEQEQKRQQLQHDDDNQAVGEEKLYRELNSMTTTKDTYCWPLRSAYPGRKSNWTCLNTAPPAFQYLYLKITTTCSIENKGAIGPINIQTGSECTCKVTHENDTCKECYFCDDDDDINRLPYIDCTNIFEEGFPCGGVNCDGDCIATPLALPKDLSLMGVLLVCIVVGFSLFLIVFIPYYNSNWCSGCIYNKTTPLTGEEASRKRLIDACITTRTLTKSDTLVANNNNDDTKDIKNLASDVSHDNPTPLEIEESVTSAPTLSIEDTAYEPCQICLEPFKIGDHVCSSLISSCNHEFHYGCIFEWLERHESCPACRETFISADHIPSETT